MFSLSRRSFLSALSKGAGIYAVGLPKVYGAPEDDYILSVMEELSIPGCSLAVVGRGNVLWTRGFGTADLASNRPMDADSILNIASISKTVTATAVMALWEQGRFELDDDVNEYLDFWLRNPAYPKTPITIRQLLSHRSSIRDNEAYAQSYTCGDPEVPLDAWIESNLAQDGSNYDPDRNFHSWRPGSADLPAETRTYTNIGYGLLGYLVEILTGTSFSSFCKEHIFDPLVMNSTGWYLKNLDVARHATPYTKVNDRLLEHYTGAPDSILAGPHYDGELPAEGSLFAHCLYSFPNYPDGLLRTSVADLAMFLAAYSNGGSLDGRRILKEETVSYMLSHEHFGRGLCWSERAFSNGNVLWGHGGGDPGVKTYMGFRKTDGVGVVVLCNSSTGGSAIGPLVDHLLCDTDLAA